MNEKKSIALIWVFAIAVAILVIDQAVKLWVAHTMEMGSVGQIRVFGDWFKIYYITNPGAAFGVSLPPPYGKLILTLFRIVALGLIIYYLFYLKKKQAHTLLLICIGMILAGALGNLIDSTFYGVFLGLTQEGASTPWFHGEVVDMFYIDIWQGFVPDSWPLIGGKYMSLWPIFNIADSSIFVGVLLILIFQKRLFGKANKEKATMPDALGEEPTIK